MIQFVRILFGGLVLVFVGIAVIWGSGRLWREIPPDTLNFDGSVIESLTSTIRYTANEEEDVINAAIETLPTGKADRITARSYLVKNLSTGSVWTEYDSERLLPVASITKLVTAVVARRLIHADARIEITPRIIMTFGNTAGFKAGEVFTSSDLMYPLLMVSSNDAAEAFAQRYGRKNFIKEMNSFTQSIGAYRTYFVDPSGLSEENVSTATDLSLIIDWIRENDPNVLNLSLTKVKKIRTHTWINPTHFLSWSYYLGGKNGFTDEAGRTSVSLFRLGFNKDVYAIVTLGSDNRDADVIRLINKVK